MINEFDFHRFRPNFRFGLDFCQTKIIWSCPNRHLLTSGLDNLNSSTMVDISVFEVKTPSSVQAAYCMSNSKYNKKMKIFSKSAAYALITVINMTTAANATVSDQSSASTHSSVSAHYLVLIITVFIFNEWKIYNEQFCFQYIRWSRVYKNFANVSFTIHKFSPRLCSMGYSC